MMNTQNAPEYQTTRIWKATHRRLRIVAAHTGESMVEVLDRLVRQEAQRLRLPELGPEDAAGNDGGAQEEREGGTGDGDGTL
jgi:hypothetical protein